MARPLAPVKVMQAKKLKIFDIVIYQNKDIAQFAKNLKSKYMWKPIEKGVIDALLEFRGGVQKNLTSMKAVLSGYLRNEFPITLVRPNYYELKGLCYSQLYYALLVHEGWGTHAKAGKKGRKGGKLSSGQELVEGNKAPASIISLQRKLLKMRKHPSQKGKRPFFTNSFESNKNIMINLVFAGVRLGFIRAFNMCTRKVNKMFEGSGIKFKLG